MIRSKHIPVPMSNKGLVFVRKLESKTIIVAVLDTESVPKLQTESQHLVIVQTGNDITSLSIFHATSRDRKEEAKGYGIDGLLRLPIWQN